MKKYTVIYRNQFGVIVEHHHDTKHYFSSRVMHFHTLPLALASVFHRVLHYVPIEKRLLWEPEYRTEWETAAHG